MTSSPSWFLGLRVADAEALRRAVANAPEEIRTTLARDLHVTVSYFGPVTEVAARRAFAYASARLPAAIDAVTGPPILLGSARFPRSVCALFAGGVSELSALIRALENPCRAEAGLEPETREPVPHCTLGVILRRVSRERHAELLAWANSLETAGHSLQFDALHLYTRAEPTSATRYRCVDSVRLR